MEAHGRGKYAFISDMQDLHQSIFLFLQFLNADS